MIFQEQDRIAIQQRLAAMTAPVKLIYFTQELECPTCRDTQELLRAVADLSDKLSLEVYNFVTDKEIAEKYEIDKIPATVVAPVDGDARAVRYFGVPSGYEFASLLDDILMVSSGHSGLTDASKEAVRRIEAPVRLQVFVTPTCPYCPVAVRLAHQMAWENGNIIGDMVEAIEFPYLAQRYRIMGVPRTVINEKDHVEGALPEAQFVGRIVNAVLQETV
jgi:glutaredoxin-like protein